MKLRFGEINKDRDTFGYVWRDGARNVIWDSAVEYCANQGGRLPSVRELAEFTIGTQRIKEISEFAVESEANKLGYSLVEAKNSDGSLANFYIKYETPTSMKEAMDLWLWTSSVNPRYQHLAISLYSGRTGGHAFLDVLDYHAFRCVFDR